MRIPKPAYVLIVVSRFPKGSCNWCGGRKCTCCGICTRAHLCACRI